MTPDSMISSSYRLLEPRHIYDHAFLGVDDAERPFYCFETLCDLSLDEKPDLDHENIPEFLAKKLHALGEASPGVIHRPIH